MESKNEANVRKYRVLSSIYDWFARNPLWRGRGSGSSNSPTSDRVTVC